MPFDPEEDDGLGYEFYEKAAAESPTQAGFAIDGGRVVGQWFTKTPLDQMPNILWERIVKVLGDCEPGEDDEGARTGRLHRKLPACYPLFPWLTADRISSIVGLGAADLTTFEDEDLYECEPLVRAYASYIAYRFQIEFVHKPYKIIGDEAINFETVPWYDDDGISTDVDCYQEWKRFTDYDVMPAAEE